MSFEAELQAAALAALGGVPGTNGVFLERPARATPPYFVLGELLSADWGVKGAAGREVRLLVRVHDEGEDWSRAVGVRLGRWGIHRVGGGGEAEGECAVGRARRL